ncbi:glycoprotease [Legionella beliardensis]|uniref:tRNA threonylcarbamoyladenosine biosynthesis protein TsaB n=1 Tax=Legionella beliardensis TaxID=91822 RepID=A0A378I3H2_9GAMM|nr:tRNA (adenosine(37)-N6)-threonylcarbamoyltransferase complex dimerization subunit type 1 TsaB [Legionella beliardensis]STX29412.1 glycoprotease [Legionella beliardensis]
MKLLAFDTSTSIASIALFNQGKITELSQVGQGQHAQFILSMIDQLLGQENLSIAELDGIVFGRGPGSFTGLRIACSLAKGLAYPHNLPVYPVSSLATLAYEITLNQNENDAPAILAMIDARMNQVYWAYYRDNSWLDVAEYVSDAADINIITDKPLRLAGIGYQAYYQDLPQSLKASVVKQQEVSLKASTMIRLVLAEQVAPITALEALPSYIRNQVTHVSK